MEDFLIQYPAKTYNSEVKRCVTTSREGSSPPLITVLALEKVLESDDCA